MSLHGTKRVTLALLATLASAGVGLTAPMTALANSKTQEVFIAHYEHNAQTAASLQQKAQAGASSSSSVAASYSGIVTSINQQILSLYAAEQALANLESSVSSVNQNSANLTALQNRRAKLEAQSRAEQSRIRQESHNKKNRRLVEDLRLRHQVTLKELQEVNFELKGAAGVHGVWKVRPFDGALTELQTTIYHLQASVIHYTNLWIQAEKPAPSASASSPASVSGLAYASSAIAIPAAGSAAVTDVVAAQPVVKDAQGNILADNGVYTITGPAGAVGVSVDPATGAVTIQPGATQGAYVVSYRQDTVSTSVTLMLS